MKQIVVSNEEFGLLIEALAIAAARDTDTRFVSLGNAMEGRAVACPQLMRIDMNTGKVSPVIPEGWQLVPVEPTMTMLCEAKLAFMKDELKRSSTIWKSMLAAAPKPEGWS